MLFIKTEGSANFAQIADFSILKEFVVTVLVETAQEDTESHVEISC